MGLKQQIKITNRTDLIRDYIKREHLTQKQFAERCGVSNSYISKLLAGTSSYKTATLEKVLIEVGLKFQDFFVIEFIGKTK